jgi:hypothetical protein
MHILKILSPAAIWVSLEDMVLSEISTEGQMPHLLIYTWKRRIELWLPRPGKQGRGSEERIVQLAQWSMPVFLATWEVEIGRIADQGQPPQKS